jgi:hypothetical protein
MEFVPSLWTALVLHGWLSGLGPTAELGGLWKPPNNPTTQGVAPLVNPAMFSPLFWRVPVLKTQKTSSAMTNRAAGESESRAAGASFAIGGKQ